MRQLRQLVAPLAVQGLGDPVLPTEVPQRAVAPEPCQNDLEEHEIQAVRDTVPEPLGKLCHAALGTCTTEDMEGALRVLVRAELDRLEVGEVELSVHVAASRDPGATSFGVLLPALIGVGALRWRRRRDGHTT
jgi:hypothetical protein